MIYGLSLIVGAAEISGRAAMIDKFIVKLRGLGTAHPLGQKDVC
jgi:hypothetical protein